MAEARRLADRLEGRWALHPDMQEAAAELRRLHADNKLICSALNGWIRENSPGGWIDGLRTQRDALLEVLKYIDKEFRQHGRQHWPEAVRVRAAIKAVEEGK